LSARTHNDARDGQTHTRERERERESAAHTHTQRKRRDALKKRGSRVTLHRWTCTHTRTHPYHTACGRSLPLPISHTHTYALCLRLRLSHTLPRARQAPVLAFSLSLRLSRLSLAGVCQRDSETHTQTHRDTLMCTHQSHGLTHPQTVTHRHTQTHKQTQTQRNRKKERERERW